VGDVVVLRGVPPLTESAIKAVKQWRYEPTLRNGVPVPVIMTVTVNFKLDGVAVQYHGLLGSLDHANEHVREAAAINLGNLRSGGEISEADVRKAIRALEPLAEKDESPRVRAAASRSLSRLDGRPLPAGLAGAGPVDKPSRTAVAWGTFSNPEGDSDVQVDGERIVIRVPPGHRDLAVETAPMLAPRLLRPVTGDFDAEVGVDALPEPGPPLAQRSFRGAGILLWQDERTYVRLESATYRVRPSATPYAGVRLAGDVRFALLEARKDGKVAGRYSPADVRLGEGPVELQLQRRGRTLLGLVRQGGGEWRQVGKLDIDLAPALEIGLAAVNIARSELRIGLDGFRVAPVGLAEAAQGSPGRLPPPAADLDEGGDSPPRPLRQARPQYPREAFQKKIQGTVLVEILIDSDGRVTRSRILQSVPGLDEAALDCMRSWTFTPARKGGRAVPTMAHVPITFRIDK
jgi:TonB family protein